MPVRNAVEIEHGISAFAAQPNGGLLVTPANPGLEVIGRLALYYHLPLMLAGGNGRFGPEGMLMSHGPDGLDLTRRASSYVDRILRSVWSVSHRC
jgi:putative tryptophan/tyrosine transport system substrate-binding protein